MAQLLPHAPMSERQLFILTMVALPLGMGAALWFAGTRIQKWESLRCPPDTHRVVTLKQRDTRYCVRKDSLNLLELD